MVDVTDPPLTQTETSASAAGSSASLSSGGSRGSGTSVPSASASATTARRSNSSSTSTTAVRRTLIDHLGGPEKFRATVDEFYFRVLDDPLLTPFFEGVDMRKLKWHSFNLIGTVFSDRGREGRGPDGGDIDEFLRSKHARLFDAGLNEGHFDAFVGHFVQTMVFLGIEQSVVEEARGIMVPYRDIFVEGAKAAGERRDEAGGGGRAATEKGGEGTKSDGRWGRVVSDPSAIGLGILGLVAAGAVTSVVLLRRRRL